MSRHIPIHDNRKERHRENGRVAEAVFFSDQQEWRSAVSSTYPGADVRTDCAGVSRAFVNGRKVGAFGKLPHHGYIASLDMAKKMNTNRQKLRHTRTPDKDPVASSLRRSVALKAAWAKRKAERQAAHQPKVVRLSERLAAIAARPAEPLMAKRRSPRTRAQGRI